MDELSGAAPEPHGTHAGRQKLHQRVQPAQVPGHGFLGARARVHPNSDGDTPCHSAAMLDAVKAFWLIAVSQTNKAVASGTFHPLKRCGMCIWFLSRELSVRNLLRADCSFLPDRVPSSSLSIRDPWILHILITSTANFVTKKGCQTSQGQG